ncbi:MAG: hypothetical protein ACXQTI_09735 [Candidatus Nezhaarchaeales archaeon]
MTEDLIRDIMEEEELVKKMVARCKHCSRKCNITVKEVSEG